MLYCGGLRRELFIAITTRIDMISTIVSPYRDFRGSHRNTGVVPVFPRLIVRIGRAYCWPRTGMPNSTGGGTEILYSAIGVTITQ